MSIFLDDHKRSDKPARAGWAPGNYLHKCGTCGAGFCGDKRAITCADCAYAIPDDVLNRRACWNLLCHLLKAKSVRWGEFTLSSGKTSDFYCDARMTTFDPAGAQLAGLLLLDAIHTKCNQLGALPVAIGGLTLGADPLALATAMASLSQPCGVSIGGETHPLKLTAFTVRKQPKTHGTGKVVEGNFKPGDKVVICDDTLTTGASSVDAVRKIRDAGGEVLFVAALVDREEGAKEMLAAEGLELVSLFTRKDLAEK